MANEGDKRMEPHELPHGWTQFRSNGLATNEDKDVGGIIDCECNADGSQDYTAWFVIFSCGIATINGLPSKRAAFEAHLAALSGRV
jgi:hypothetical protein